MLPGYGKSFTVWCSPDQGTTLWPFTFVDDYIDRQYVKMRYRGYDDIWYDVKLSVKTNFASDFVLEVTPPIPPCTMVDIYRDTPKDFPIVIYGNGGTILAAESRNAAVRQSLHVLVEMTELSHRTDLECLCGCVEAV